MVAGKDGVSRGSKGFSHIYITAKILYLLIAFHMCSNSYQFILKIVKLWNFSI